MRGTLILVVAALLVAGCGEEEVAYDLSTPKARADAPPVPLDASAFVDPQVTPRLAQQARPVIQGWARAVAAGDPAAAARFFEEPTIVGLGEDQAVELRSEATTRAFNVSLPCAPRLISVRPDGRYVVGAFVQDELAGRPCDEAGDVSRIGFVFGDPDHPDRITEWWQTEDDEYPSSRPRDAVPVKPLDLAPQG